MSGYSWRFPFALACQPCLRRHIYTTDEQAITEHRRNATSGVKRTGRIGPRRGKYHRITVEVRHEACGHTWFTTYYHNEEERKRDKLSRSSTPAPEEKND